MFLIFKKPRNWCRKSGLQATNRTWGAEQINKAIQQLDQITQQNSTNSEEMAATAEELAEQAEQLQKTVTFFKTGTTTLIESAPSSETTIQQVTNTATHDPKTLNQDELS